MLWVSTPVDGRGTEEEGTELRSWAGVPSQQRPQPTPWDALGLGWSCSTALSRGEGPSLYALVSASCWLRPPPEDKAALLNSPFPFGKDNQVLLSGNTPRS